VNEGLVTDVPVSDARLSVHAHVDDPIQNGGIRALWRSLLGWPREARQSRPRMQVHVADRQGQNVQCVETSDAFVELPLAPGTYDVIVKLGTTRRRYTMTLVAGASCDLHLRLEGTA